MEGDFSTNITSEGKDEQTYELETECERLLKDMKDFYSVSAECPQRDAKWTAEFVSEFQVP